MMKKRQQSLVSEQAVVPTDEKAIDKIYGLEPVIDIEGSDEHAEDGNEGTCFVTIDCPYCGESYDTRIDLTGGSFEYIEDCQVCCQPILLKVEVNAENELINIASQQLND